MPAPKPRLMKLEALRGFAAIYVFLAHSNVLVGTRGEVLLRFAQEAVMLFFLLSGFVIYYATFGGARVPTFSDYFGRRFRRIYPLFLLALAAAYVVGTIRGVPFPGASVLAGNVFMLQDNVELKPGVWFPTFMGDSALWSLSYEWWFYMLFFPIATQLRDRPAAQRLLVFAISAIGALMYFVYPSGPGLILGYFFIWWCGVEMGREFVASGKLTLRRQAPSAAMLAILTGLWVARAGLVLHSGTAPRMLGVDPILEARHFAGSLAMLLVGVAWFRAGLRGFDTIFRPFALLAPFSYALYIFHAIVLSAVPHENQLQHALVGLALAIPLSWILEVRLQPVLSRWLTPARPVPAKSPVTASDS